MRDIPETSQGAPMTIDKELLDRLFADYKEPEDLIGETGF